MKKKSVVLILTFALVAVCIVGGTLAWLTAAAPAVTNTFTTSDVDITLEESEDLDLKMIPGYTITKDPKVTVAAGSEKCYLFVKLEKSTNFDNFMTYTVDTGWTALEGAENIYYRVVDQSAIDRPYYVISGNTVTVKNTVTKADMNGLTENTYPTLTVTAYASQFAKNNAENFTAAEAWANVQP